MTLEVSFDQVLRLLFQLPAEEKMRLANELRAAAAAESWKTLSKRLPDLPEFSMEEIVQEVKSVRKLRAQRKKQEK